jgi:hypothetical protein
MAADAAWKRPGGPVHLKGVNWLPDLQHAKHGLLHLAFDGIEDPWRRRLSAAREAGRSITVALPATALDLDTLDIAQELQTKVIVLDAIQEGSLKVYESVADLVALYELFLGPIGLQRLAEPLLDKALAEADTYKKGLYFEQVLCLLFSQVSYLRVLSHRYINETEEIDIVLGNRATGEIHGVLSGPIVLVSGKNQNSKAGAPEVRALRGNMSGRRGRCKFGILCAARGIADTASTEQIRATTDPALAVALIDGATTRALIRSGRLDDDLAEILIRAVMD